MNYYKDQEEDLEKYKLICKFVNPEAAQDAWGTNKPKNSDTSGFTPEDDLINIIAKNRNIDPTELKDRINNPTDYDDTLDTIERVK